MQIEVTQQDILEGVRANAEKCPIALAIRRKLPNSWVRVRNTYIVIDGKYYGINKNIVSFVDNFDDGRPVQPKRFRIKPILWNAKGR